MNELGNGVIIIVGHTGAGKTVVASKLSEYYSVPLLTFSGLGKVLATAKGYKRLRDYFAYNPPETFKSELNSHLVKNILKHKKKNQMLIVEGLISADAIDQLRNKLDDVHVFYLDVPKEIRIERICQRLRCTVEEAEQEECLKNNIKETLGINEVIAASDYVIDGTQTVDSIIDEIVCKKCFMLAKTRAW